ncbi:MAG: threonylcarbamoyl-AMP synthase [Ruminiclostridium sp.]|nr:threonylcarbamoyl-AMP synthase [Ruminiclostridium sp.]
MKTDIIKININNPEPDKLQHAAEVLRNGGLVAFPTETVYGLGADATNGSAVSGIFKAKGRPSDNPLIVHIADSRDLDRLTALKPEVSEHLIKVFWPGPLTLVMPRSSAIPDIVTASLDSVAIRMPSHPVALALIQKAGVPVAAPSANSSGKPSPTCARHVIDDLDGKVDIIIDGGSVEVGLESTVLDITSPIPVILRPGGITREQLESVIGRVDICPSLMDSEAGLHVPKSPGMKYRHYAPEARIVLFEGKPEKVCKEISRIYRQNTGNGIKSIVLATDETVDCYKGIDVITMGSRKNPDTIASRLFHILREFNDQNVQVILAESIEDRGIGFAVMNRLIKASGYNVVKV